MMFRAVFWVVMPLMMEAVRTSETSVDNHFTRQYNPEDSSEHLTLTGLFSWLKALTHSDWGYCRWWDGEPVRPVLVLYEKNFGWADVWEVSPERWDGFCLWSLRLGVESFWLRTSMISCDAAAFMAKMMQSQDCTI
jgi:hypothetical protein